MSKFHCIEGCAQCCSGDRWVNLTLKDLRRIAKRLDKSLVDTFNEIAYPRIDGDFWSLKMLEPCTFLKDNRCSIYEDRPSICRIFPFNMLAKGEKVGVPCLTGKQIPKGEVMERKEEMEQHNEELFKTRSEIPELRDVKEYRDILHRVKTESLISQTRAPFHILVHNAIKKNPAFIQHKREEIVRRLEVIDDEG